MSLTNVFLRKQRHVQALIARYLDGWMACVRTFESAWETFLTQGRSDDFNFQVEQTHKAESHADDVRRLIARELYGKALLPESRADIHEMISRLDRLLGDAQRSLFDLKLQHIDLPEELKPLYQKLVTISVRCCVHLEKSVRLLFIDRVDADGVISANKEIDKAESEADFVQCQLVDRIFSADYDTANKILYREVGICLGRITDYSESAANYIMLLSIKHHI
ncbi:MAG: DUF47 family protein [Deltaproteobacteria bacterium]|nr:DUF47 family protein [Deltaproteobacteria bacterium]